MVDEPHGYLSTACLHGWHDYCRAPVGIEGPKKPATCKWCDARCVCPCGHEAAEADLGVTPT